jgi:hypothetical protein
MPLFEFSLKLTFENGTVRETLHQLPANNDTQALVALGRSFPHREDNDFTLEILSMNMVGEFKAKFARDALVEKILNHSFSEPDWDSRSGGACKAFYEVKNLFTSEDEGKETVNRVLDAYEAVRK